MFYRFRAEIMVCGKSCHANSLKDRNDWFSTGGWEWTILSNCNLGMPKLWKFWKFWKIIVKKWYSQKWSSFSTFQKTGMNVTEPCKAHMFTNFQVDVLKNDRVLVFWRSKAVIFHAVPVTRRKSSITVQFLLYPSVGVPHTGHHYVTRGEPSFFLLTRSFRFLLL